MSVYVDNAFGHPSWGKWHGGGHLVADSHEELEAFARRLGLKPQWIQKAGTRLEHYDVQRRKRELAIACGAIPITTREMGQRLIDLIDKGGAS